MYLSFLKSRLPHHTLSFSEGFPILSSEKMKPRFCLLPKFPSVKKVKKVLSPDLIFILPISSISSYFFRKQILFFLQPLFFVSRKEDGSFVLFDRRYLKLEKGLYRLPSLEVDLSTLFSKDSALKEKEDLFFFSSRDTPFYFKGDTTDRLNTPSYEKALLLRKHAVPKKRLSAFYLLLKNKIDN